MADLNVAFAEFRNDLLREAEVSGDPQPACFFKLFSEAAAANGDCIDLDYTPARKEGVQGYQINGYAVDIDRGELFIAVCDFRADDELEPLDQKQIDSLCGRAERFIKFSQLPEFVNSLEETSPAFEAAYPIYNRYGSIKRVRIIVFSNARLVTRKKYIESKAVQGKTFTYNVLDITRYADIIGSRTGSEPIEINLVELNGSPLPCLSAYTGSSVYASYLIVLPGSLLAKIYGLYGPSLLEQNVRTFLQAKTKVNKGIITTLEESPEMFFAYNNGLTATASSIELDELAGGICGIKSISNLQIVNGGQTTASILYAEDQRNANLEQVFVQMKLSVINEEQVVEVVPKISRCANTQNKVTEADFFSNDPFHIEIEKISRRLATPPKEGALTSTKWFYERARGQYKDKLAYGTAAAKRKFEAEFPYNQLIDKPDLAKYDLTFDCKPNIVSQLSQKCFLAFAEKICKIRKDKAESLNEGYFKESVAKAIVFRWTDHMVATSSWYKNDRGYKLQIVTYTIAWLVNNAKTVGKSIDFLQIWNKQEVPDDVKSCLEHCAPIVASKIKDAPSSVKNVGEYCKHQACWAAVSGLQIDLPRTLRNSIIDVSQVRLQRKDDAEVKKIDNEIDFETRLIELVPHVARITTFATSRRLLSGVSSNALLKLLRGKVVMNYSEKSALKVLFSRLADEGFELP